MLATLALPLAGCGDGRRRYRYRLTLEAEVDGETVRESTVIESWAYDVVFPHAAVRTGKTGEALVMELRPGRFLVALLEVVTQVPDPVRGGNWTRQRGDWGKFRQAYGYKPPLSETSEAYWSSLQQFRGDRDWSLDDLPDLVTFDDVNDPRTVKLVDPRNLEASFGQGVRLTRASIAIVDNDTPLTRGIEKKLPWITPLDGNYLSNFGSAKTSSAGSSLPRFCMVATSRQDLGNDHSERSFAINYCSGFIQSGLQCWNYNRCGWPRFNRFSWQRSD